MRQILFSIGSVNIYGYGLMVALAAIAATGIAMKRAKIYGLSADVVLNIALIGGGCGFVGAKLLYIIVEFKSFIKDPVSILTGGGLVVFGGLIIGIFAAFLYLRKKEGGFLKYFDLVMPGLAISQGIGRIGCLLAGCCYGREWDSPLALVFPEGGNAPAGVGLFPSQIVMCLGDILIGVILIILAKKITKTGLIGCLYAAMYSAGRFLVEFTRGDERGSIGPLSTSQFISIFTFIGALVLIYVLKTKLWDKEQVSGISKEEMSENEKEAALENEETKE